MIDLAIDIDNAPGALAHIATAISDAGVNISAATCPGAAERAELHILVPHAEAATVDRAGHQVQNDQPEACAALLADFMREPAAVGWS